MLPRTSCLRYQCMYLGRSSRVGLVCDELSVQVGVVNIVKLEAGLENLELHKRACLEMFVLSTCS